MKWLEIIRLRTEGIEGLPKDMHAELAQQLKQCPESQELKKVNLYAHTSVPNDLMISMTWDTPDARPWGSELGKSLSRELRQYGLTDHSVWIEKNDV